MRKNILLRTNIFVCIIIILGFIITSVISYFSNKSIFEKDAEHVSDLASEGIYYQIDSIFTKPINVSITMANDSLLKSFLSEEEQHLEDEAFIKNMQDYLYAYREKYSFDSVFLVSAKTNRYYHFNGLDRILMPDNEENEWYYSFMQEGDEYSLNIDNDEASDNEITVFVNCKIKQSDGTIMGIVGVGFRVDYLQDLLREYEEQFDVHASLINSNGMIEISTRQTGHEHADFFDECEYSDLKDKIIKNQTEPQKLWSIDKNGQWYVVTSYIKNLEWTLIVAKDMSMLNRQLNQQLLQGILIIIIIVAIVLFTITAVIRRYNKQIIKLTAAHEREYYETRQEASKHLYENIFEIDITHNCVIGENTEHYFESLGVPRGTPFDQSIKIIAENQIKEEYRKGYLDSFSPQNISKQYKKGIKSLSYEFIITSDDKNDYWMRIMACIYFWSKDQSIRMTVYRQNIDAQKKQEEILYAQMQSDPLTGIYNKATTEEKINEVISAKISDKLYAFIMLDIDNFKGVNDTLGHSAGDYVISNFAKTLKEQFEDTDVVGRIGGDEFAVFLQIPSIEWLEKKAQSVVNNLHRNVVTDSGDCTTSASMGIAIYPQSGTDFITLYKNADIALYQSKARGKNRYTICNIKPHR